MVRDLVSHGGRHGAPSGGARALRVEEDQLFAKGDQAGVLHRAEGELGDGDEIELGVGVGAIEILAEQARVRRGGLEHEVAEGPSPWW